MPTDELTAQEICIFGNVAVLLKLSHDTDNAVRLVAAGAEQLVDHFRCYTAQLHARRRFLESACSIRPQINQVIAGNALQIH